MEEVLLPISEEHWKSITHDPFWREDDTTFPESVRKAAVLLTNAIPPEQIKQEEIDPQLLYRQLCETIFRGWLVTGKPSASEAGLERAIVEAQLRSVFASLVRKGLLVEVEEAGEVTGYALTQLGKSLRTTFPHPDNPS
jgi:hypothetical protein